MIMDNFNKERFSHLLKIIVGDHSINQYGRLVNVDPGYISRLFRCLINKAPSVKIISKLSSNKHYYQDLMIAAGYLSEQNNYNKQWVQGTEIINFAANNLSEQQKQDLLKIIELYIRQCK
jgi:hypothetical protein